MYLFKQKSCFYAVLETSFSLLLSLLVSHQDQGAFFLRTRRDAVDPLSRSAQAAVINYHWLNQQTLIFHGSSSCWWLEVYQDVSMVRFWRRPSSWFIDHCLAISSYSSEKETISCVFLVRALTSSVKAPPSWPSYLPKVCPWVLSHVRLFATPGTVAHQASLSMGFSRQEYGSGLPFPTPGDLQISRWAIGLQHMNLEEGNTNTHHQGVQCVCNHPCSALFIFLLLKAMHLWTLGGLLESRGWLQTLLRQSKLSLDLSKAETCRGERHGLWPH